jgi:hypothetical protein
MDDDDRKWCRNFADAMGLSVAEVESNFAKAEASGGEGFLALVREKGILIHVGPAPLVN